MQDTLKFVSIKRETPNKATELTLDSVILFYQIINCAFKQGKSVN